eukprot:scaffold93354_cov32-Phaeocystis_antarctica.AAC.1
MSATRWLCRRSPLAAGDLLDLPADLSWSWCPPSRVLEKVLVSHLIQLLSLSFSQDRRSPLSPLAGSDLVDLPDLLDLPGDQTSPRLRPGERLGERLRSYSWWPPSRASRLIACATSAPPPLHLRAEEGLRHPPPPCQGSQE